VLIYYLLGIFVFTSLEDGPCSVAYNPQTYVGSLPGCSNCTFVEFDPTTRRVLNGEDYCTQKWSVVDAVYFSTVTVTTVGYGDLTPHTSEGRIFAIVWTLYGLCVVLSIVSQVAEVHSLTFHSEVKEEDSSNISNIQYLKHFLSLSFLQFIVH